MLAALAIGALLLGLAVGSFVNVVVYRVPRRESLVAPGSHCPACDTPLSGWENIPLISFIVLGRRCRHCRAPISFRYPLTELAVAALFCASAVRFGFNWALPAYLVLAAGLVALFETDLLYGTLPRRIVIVDGALVACLLLLASAETGAWYRLVVALCCAAVWFAALFAIHAVDRRLLGFGDVRLAAVLGLALGWLGIGYVLVGFIAANVIGAAIGIVLIQKGKATGSSRIAYGPFLAAGCEFAVLFGSPLLSPFHGL